MEYYCNGIDEVTYHDTAEEARKEADDALRWCRDQAPDGWPDEIHWIHWGKVIQWCAETNRMSKEECEKAGIYFNEDWDVYLDYGLVDTKETESLRAQLAERDSEIAESKRLWVLRSESLHSKIKKQSEEIERLNKKIYNK